MQQPNHSLTTLMPAPHKVEFLLTRLHSLEGTLSMTMLGTGGGGWLQASQHREETPPSPAALSSHPTLKPVGDSLCLAQAVPCQRGQLSSSCPPHSRESSLSLPYRNLARWGKGVRFGSRLVFRGGPEADLPPRGGRGDVSGAPPPSSFRSPGPGGGAVP
ncbi:UNVERIFIED_CONTAM: hypothetical protein K2H54_066858 [Gekko kuhli]